MSRSRLGRRLVCLATAFTGGALTGLAAGFTFALVTLFGNADGDSATPFRRALEDPRTARWIGLVASLASAVLSTVIVARLAQTEAMAADPRARRLLAGFATLGLVPGLVAGALLTLSAHGR